MATYWENSCSFGLRYVSWYKYLIVSLFFSHLGFWSGNLFLIAPFPDLCLLVPFCNRDAEKWTQALNKSDKLRTYKTYKCNLEREWYCTLPLSRDHRRVLFRLRSCSLPLEIETGRYTKPKTPLTDRLCKYCHSSAIEDETHFLLDCDLYTDIRSTLFEKALCLDENFYNLETSHVLLAGVSGGFSPGTPVFAPPTDWFVSI